MIKTYRKIATIQAEQFDGSQKMIAGGLMIALYELGHLHEPEL